MIVESLDEYLETLAGYIFDNDKLVTYKWLSKELEVHVNVAKQILWEFGQRHQGEESLVRTFLLVGILNDGGMRVEVVKEENLSTAKEKFSKIISEHIYSLQKTLPDIDLLAISGEGDVKYSAIKCAECIERSDEEMHTLRWGQDAGNNIQAAAEKKEKHVPETTVEKKEKSPEKKNSDIKKNMQNKGFNSLFGKTVNKRKSPSSSNVEKVETSKQKKQESTKVQASISPKKKLAKSGLDGFLEHGKNQQKSTNSVSPKEEEVINSTTKENTKEIPIAGNSKEQKKNVRGKKRNRSKESATVIKRRKRITIQSESSDSRSSSEEEEPELPPSPQPASPIKGQSPSPPRIKLEGGKRKILKMVDKTFEEDGYLVTKKVHVYESCSEEEIDAVEQKKPSVPEPRPEPKGKKSAKQTMLTNFFKKS